MTANYTGNFYTVTANTNQLAGWVSTTGVMHPFGVPTRETMEVLHVSTEPEGPLRWLKRRVDEMREWTREGME